MEDPRHRESICKEEKNSDSSSSSSDSENEVPLVTATPAPAITTATTPPATVKPAPSTNVKQVPSKKISPLFGREKPVHLVLGGGKPADIFLWRDKKISAGVFASAAAIWVLFEFFQIHLLTLLSHCLIIALALLFLWSTAYAFINKSMPSIPKIYIPEAPVLEIANVIRIELNRAISALRDIASGNVVQFVYVVGALWLLSIVGSSCNFLTLAFIAFVTLHTVPVFYETFEDQVDAFAEKAMVEIKKQYTVFDAKVLSKIPRGPLKQKKKN